MKKKITLIVLAVVILFLAAAGLWYTRPMTLEQLCPGIELSECVQLRVYFFQSAEDRPASSGSDELTLTTEDPEFSALLGQFQGRTFRRSLLGLLPQGTRTHATSAGDFKWEVIFRFEQISLPDGSTVSGDMLQLSNFFGTLDISFDGETWRATTGGKNQWLADVMAVINAAQAD